MGSGLTLSPLAEPRAEQGGGPYLCLPQGTGLSSVGRWFCHVDDDNYVNPEGLLHLLSTFSPNQDVYLGRPSLDHPIEATERVQGGGTVSVA